jgi:hypothetical protein
LLNLGAYNPQACREKEPKQPEQGRKRNHMESRGWAMKRDSSSSKYDVIGEE